jgi:esterase/lipase superfamily enzyme
LTLRIALIALSLSLVAAVRSPAAADCAQAPVANAVYFVTDRARIDGDQFFSGERGITASRDAVVTRGIMLEKGDGTYREDRCSSESAFIAALAKSVAATPKLLVYVHGYYTSFRQALSDALAVRAGLKFTGPAILYSWPSKATSRLAYVKDEANASWSIPRFRRLAATIETRFKSLPVYVTSHSLGARFAADAIETYRRGQCPKCVRRAAFFAPDIDADTLHSELAETGLCHGRPPTKPSSAAPMTIYVSNKDLALRQSQSLHGFERAGTAGSEMVLCGGTDTIDVSYYKSSDKTGHSYQTDARILSDTRAAFAGVAPTDPSRKLTIAKRDRGQYYELR